MNLPAKITGGRPMRKIGFAFTDTVTGKPIFYFKDLLGRAWLAEHRWASFRVKADHPVGCSC